MWRYARHNWSNRRCSIHRHTELRGVRVHLYGIDAPEEGQLCETAAGRSYPCGHEATRLLRKRIGEGPVTCEPHKLDGKGRAQATCKVGGEDLSAWLVSQGYALASRSVSTAYVRQEARAWATVSKESGGGNESGSGRGKAENHSASSRGGEAHKSGSAEQRSAAARKGWDTRRRNGNA